MMELSHFASRVNRDPSFKLLAIFYYISLEELSWGIRFGKWKKQWTGMAKRLSNRKNTCPSLINSVQGKCIRDITHGFLEALDTARQMWIGLEFAKIPKIQMSFEIEGNYIQDIIASICRLVAPDIRFKDSHVRGKNRLCQIVTEMFDKMLPHQVLFLGMYGLPGSGKSTLSKCLCNRFYREFSGRVFYEELPKTNIEAPLSKEDHFKVMRKILMYLTNYSDTTNYALNAREQYQYLVDERRPLWKAFVVIDNVSSSSQNLAEDILKFRFKPGTKVLIISSDKRVLQSLLYPPSKVNGISSLVHMPTINASEAAFILLDAIYGPNYYPPSTSCSDTAQKIAEWLKRMSLVEYLTSHGVSETSRWYRHPLAIKILGGFISKQVGGSCQDLHGINNDTLEYLQEQLKENCEIMTLLEMSYKQLTKNLQDLFLDINFAMFDRWHVDLTELCEWLNILHCKKQSVETIRLQLNELKASGFILEGFPNVVEIHELVRQFGQTLLKDPKSKYVCITSESNIERKIDSNGKLQVETNKEGLGVYGNACLKEASVEGSSSLRALVLRDCKCLRQLNLGGADSLVILVVRHCTALQMVHGLSSVVSTLKLVVWSDNNNCSTSQLLSNHEAVGIMQPWLNISGWKRQCRGLNFPVLQRLELGGEGVENCIADYSLEQLCPELKTLYLFDVRRKMPDIHNLSKLENLTIKRCGNDSYADSCLDLSGCFNLQEVSIRTSDLWSTLPILSVDLNECFNLTQLWLQDAMPLDLSITSNLQYLNIILRDCGHMLQKRFLHLHNLKQLEHVSISSKHLTQLDFEAAKNLEFLEIRGAPIEKLSTCGLVNLQWIVIDDCEHLTQLDFEGAKNLEFLEIFVRQLKS